MQDEYLEFRSLKATLKDDMPYKTLGGFRRARRAGSAEYNKTKKDYTFRIDMETLDREYNLIYNDNGSNKKVGNTLYNATRHNKHYSEMGIDIKDVDAEIKYANKAKKLLESIVDSKAIYGFTDDENWIYRYNIHDNEFAVARPDGQISTIFKPKQGIVYFIGEVRKRGRKK